jgi:hypothetical protein
MRSPIWGILMDGPLRADPNAFHLSHPPFGLSLSKAPLGMFKSEQIRKA